MYCTNCGKTLKEGTSFCVECGAMVAQVTAKPILQPFCTSCGKPMEPGNSFCVECGAESQASGGTKKRRLKLKFIIPAAVLVAAIIGVSLFMAQARPLMSVQRSLANFGDDVAERLDTSPLSAVRLLNDIMEDGTITVDFRDRWAAFDFDATLRSNTQNREFAVELEVYTFDGHFDFEAYIDRHRIMARSLLLDNNFYGIRYSSFRDDFRPLGRLLGWDNREKNQLSDIVENFGESINDDRTAQDLLRPYLDVLSDFIRTSNYTSERVSITTQGNSVNTTRVQFEFSMNDIYDLLNDLFRILERDENFRRSLSVRNERFYHDLMRMLRMGISDIRRYATGDIELTFYIGSRNRLVRMSLEADLLIDRERLTVRMNGDFGLSSTDTWMIDFIASERNYTESANVRWSFAEIGGRYEHTLTVTANQETATLRSVWRPQNGAFTLSADYIENRWDWITGRTERTPVTHSVSGVFNRQPNNGFNLVFDDFGFDFDRSASLTIAASPGARFDPPREFINIDRWDEVFVDRVDQLLWDIGF
jgi:predicted nucleic acid-binding Zn ribbon protein